MKVLLATNMYPTPSYSFYGIFVDEFVTSMRTLGVEMDVFFTDARESRFRYAQDIPRFRKIAAQKKYDLFHAQHTLSVYQIMLSGVRLFHKTPLLLTLHEAEVLAPPDVQSAASDPIGKFVYTPAGKLPALNYVDHVVSVERTMPDVIGYRKPFTVTPPGIDMRLFVPKDRDECRRKLNWPLDRKIVFFPASPKRSIHKGYAFLEAAMNLLPGEIQLECGGNIAHEAMVDYMNAADVVIQTSNFEASPMVIKEAMACNAPIVSTDVGDVRWIMGETEGTFICKREPEDIAQKIRLALERNVRTKGRDRLNELDISLEGIAKKYAELYRTMVQGTASK